MGYSYGTSDILPPEATHTFPVTPSIIVLLELGVNLSGLVRLFRRIAAKTIKPRMRRRLKPRLGRFSVSDIAAQ